LNIENHICGNCTTVENYFWHLVKRAAHALAKCPNLLRLKSLQLIPD
jgi:hypothetical protein